MNMNEIYHEGHEAGMKALNACVPEPMGVYQSDVFGNRLGPTEIVSDGVCGFAWVTIPTWRKSKHHEASPKINSDMVKFLKSRKIGHKHYGHSAWDLWVSEGNQSMTRKEAYANAMAKVFQNYGITCYADSRMD